MATLEELEKRIQRFAKALPQNASNIVAKAAIASLQSVVIENPVDTGRSRGNYFISINAATENFQENRRNSIGPGVAVANTIGPDDTLHLTNNTTYINKLNEGSSAQAPAGFIEAAVLVAAAAVAANQQIILEGL